MTVIAVVAGVSGLVIAVLVYAVWTLRADVRALGSQLTELRSAPTQSDVLAVAGHHVVPQDAESVPVITHLSDTESTDDGLEVTRARVASVTLARPLIKVAAFSHGVRRALDDERRMRISWAMRQEFRRQRKMRRRRRAGRAPSEGWRP